MEASETRRKPLQEKRGRRIWIVWWMTRGAAAVVLAAVVVPGPLRAERGMGTPTPAVTAAQANEEALVTKAHAIHDKVIALDTHNDINRDNFTPERNYTQRLDNQVNLPKMIDGGLRAYARFASLTIKASRTSTAAPRKIQNHFGEMNAAPSGRDDSGPALTSAAGAPISLGASRERS
jgi:hypothetical protein